MSFQQFNQYPGLTPVRVVSTSNQTGTYFNGQTNNGVGATFTYATGALTIDSVVVVSGDRVLLTAQTNGNENGIYICTTTGATGIAAVLQRSSDQQCIEQLLKGQYVSVAAGSIYAGNFYTIVEPLPAHLGIDTLQFNADPSAGGVAFSGGPSVANAIPVFSNTSGDIKPASTTTTLGQALTIAGAFISTSGNITSGSSGDAGTFISFPATAGNGTLILQAVNAGGAFNTTIASGTIGQSSVITIPDPGAATANFMLDAGTTTAKTITTLTSTTANITNLKYGATPVAQVDPASCTITAAAGAANTATVTVQLKDGSGTNMTRSIRFSVYSSSAADGLTLQSAASTGYSVASGGLSLANGTAVTTQISAMSSATGGCVLSLLDTGKLTSYLVLVLPNGNKISAQLSAGSYG